MLSRTPFSSRFRGIKAFDSQCLFGPNSILSADGWVLEIDPLQPCQKRRKSTTIMQSTTPPLAIHERTRKERTLPTCQRTPLLSPSFEFTSHYMMITYTCNLENSTNISMHWLMVAYLLEGINWILELGGGLSKSWTRGWLVGRQIELGEGIQLGFKETG